MSIVILDTGKLVRLDPDWENAGGMFPRDDGDFVRFDGLKTNVDMTRFANELRKITGEYIDADHVLEAMPGAAALEDLRKFIPWVRVSKTVKMLDTVAEIIERQQKEIEALKEINKWFSWTQETKGEV